MNSIKLYCRKTGQIDSYDISISAIPQRIDISLLDQNGQICEGRPYDSFYEILQDYEIVPR